MDQAHGLLQLLLAVLPLFETVTELGEADAKAVDDNRFFIIKFKAEARAIRLLLRPWSGRLDIVPEKCLRIWQKIAKLLHNLVSDKVSLPGSALSLNGPYPKLQLLRIYNDSTLEALPVTRYIHLQASEKTLKRIKRYYKKLDKLCTSPVQEGSAGTRRRGPAYEVRGLAHTLYHVMSRYWTCDCPDSHEAKLFLATHRGFYSSSPHLTFDMLFSTNSEDRGWQEGAICVFVPKQAESESARVKFAIDSKASQTEQVSEREAIEDICTSVTDTYKARSRLHICIDRDRPWQTQSSENQLPTADMQPTVPLGELLRSSRSLKTKELKMLAVILANSLLQLYEGPWLPMDWTKDHICFLRSTGQILLRPLLSTRFDRYRAPAHHHLPKHMIHRNPSILTFGKLLIELHYKRAFEDMKAEINRGRDENVNTDASVAGKLLEEMRGNNTDLYLRALTACLKCPKAAGSDFEDASFRQTIYEDIVVPLEDDLQFGHNVSVDDLDRHLSNSLLSSHLASLQQRVKDQTCSIRPQSPVLSVESEDQESIGAPSMQQAKSPFDTPQRFKNLKRKRNMAGWAMCEDDIVRVSSQQQSNTSQEASPRDSGNSKAENHKGRRRKRTTGGSAPTEGALRAAGLGSGDASAHFDSVQHRDTNVASNIQADGLPFIRTLTTNTPCMRSRDRSGCLALFDDQSVSESQDARVHSKNWLTRLQTLIRTLLPHEPTTTQRVKIAILDSGMDSADPVMVYNKWRIIEKRSFLLDTKQALPKEQIKDMIGHGTHTTALLLKVAPYADIYVARVTKSRDFDASRPIANAIRCAAREWDVDIISMSFGFPYPNSEVQQAINEAHSKNIIMFAAASNEGGNSRIAYPARTDEVICINSADGEGNKSSFNPIYDESKLFSTLGQAVESSWPGYLGKGATQCKSGTSYATPIAAGIAAIVLDWARRKLPETEAENLRKLRSRKGMHAVFNLMAIPRDEYKYVTLWELFDRTEASVRERILDVLRPLSV